MGKKKILEIIESRGYVSPGEVGKERHVLYRLHTLGILKRIAVGGRAYYYRDPLRVMPHLCREIRNRRRPLYIEVEEELPFLECLSTKSYKTQRGTTIYILP
jgi:hypothetical protein